ncbi:MAG: hypothetical protein ABL983_02780 [Nitrospira sp.]
MPKKNKPASNLPVFSDRLDAIRDGRMPKRKITEDPRRQKYPLAQSMERTAERIRLMCQDPAYYQHTINQRHFLPLDDAFRLQFLREVTGVSLHIELSHGKPTRDGLVYWWPVIEQWRAKLIEWQGPWRHGGIGYLESAMLARKQNGHSYLKIADWLNAMLLEDLRQGRASQLLDYFLPGELPAVVLDTPQPISPRQVRERIRYLLTLKKSR